MDETYRLLIEFKTIHSLRFWTIIFIATSLIIFAIWILSRKKQSPKTTVIAEKETVKQKPATQKENPTLVKPQTKAYTDTSVKSSLEVSEPKPVYIKPTVHSLPNNDIVYLLGYNSSFEIDLVKDVLTKNVRVILMVPYGILGLKIRKDLKPPWDESKITIVSIAQPHQSWKVNESINALKFRFKISDAILIANYEYGTLQLNEALCFVSSLVVADSFRLRNRQLLVAANDMHKYK